MALALVYGAHTHIDFDNNTTYDKNEMRWHRPPLCPSHFHILCQDDCRPCSLPKHKPVHKAERREIDHVLHVHTLTQRDNKHPHCLDRNPLKCPATPHSYLQPQQQTSQSPPHPTQTQATSAQHALPIHVSQQLHATSATHNQLERTARTILTMPLSPCPSSTQPHAPARKIVRFTAVFVLIVGQATGAWGELQFLENSRQPPLLLALLCFERGVLSSSICLIWQFKISCGTDADGVF